MDWFLLAIISTVTVAISNILKRTLMKDEKSNVFAYSVVFQLLCGAIIGIFAIINGFVMPPIIKLLPYFIIITISYTAATLLHFKALQKVGAGEVTILTSTRALWTILIAVLLLGESFTIFKLIGTILILAGVWIIPTKGFKLNEGVIYALAGAFCYGVGFATDTYILRYSEAISYTAISFILPGLLIFAINPKMSKEIKSLFRPSTLSKMVLLGIFYSIGAIAIYLAYQQGGTAAQLAPISQSVVVLTVLLAAITLGENDNLLRKLISAIIVTIGVLMLK
jgi:drug/metabolite transporter (DMT)-like permease